MNAAESIIGAILYGSKEALRLAEAQKIRVTDFADADCRAVWQAITDLLEKNKVPRLGSVEPLLRGNEPAKALAQRITGPTTQPLEMLCESIRVAGLAVDAQAVAADFSGSVSRSADVDEFRRIVRSAVVKLDSLEANLESERRDNDFHPVLDRTLAEMQRQLDAQTDGGKAPWVTTGLEQLDRLLGGGWQKPGAYVVVGMSGRGKTHLGIHFGLEASRAGAAVVYFTVEMPQSQIMRRVMANVSMVPIAAITAVNLNDEQMEQLQAIPQLSKTTRMAIEDNFGAELEQLVALIRRYRRAGKLDVAVVDYVQQLQPRKRAHTKQQDMLQVAHTLKQVCIEEGIVMIQLAQANREAETAEALGHKLNATHIEHSHAIYQNADAVTFFQSVEVIKMAKGTGLKESTEREEMLWLAKNRHGESGKVVGVRLDYERSRLSGR